MMAMAESEPAAAAEESGRDEDRKLGFYQLKHANPWELANALQVIGQYKDSEVGVVVASGQLVVFATPDMHALVTDVIARLDVPQREELPVMKRPAERRRKPERPREIGPPGGEPQP